jgi:hypothetical protein
MLTFAGRGTNAATGSELDFLSMDPILPKQEKYPIHDVAFNYTGRLVAKFLLSFDDERYIIERND